MRLREFRRFTQPILEAQWQLPHKGSVFFCQSLLANVPFSASAPTQLSLMELSDKTRQKRGEGVGVHASSNQGHYNRARPTLLRKKWPISFPWYCIVSTSSNHQLGGIMDFSTVMIPPSWWLSCSAHCSCIHYIKIVKTWSSSIILSWYDPWPRAHKKYTAFGLHGPALGLDLSVYGLGLVHTGLRRYIFRDPLARFRIISHYCTLVLVPICLWFWQLIRLNQSYADRKYVTQTVLPSVCDLPRW